MYYNRVAALLICCVLARVSSRVSTAPKIAALTTSGIDELPFVLILSGSKMLGFRFSDWSPGWEVAMPRDFDSGEARARIADRLRLQVGPARSRPVQLRVV